MLIWHRTNPFLAANQPKYGPIFTIRALPWGTAVVVNDTELVKEIFTRDPAVYHAGEGNSILAPSLASARCLVLDEERASAGAQAPAAALSRRGVSRYERDRREDRGRGDRPPGRCRAVRAAPRMQAITLEVILQAVIGVSDPARLAALRVAAGRCAADRPHAVRDVGDPGPRAPRALAALPPKRRERPTACCARRSQPGADPQLAEREDVLSQLVRAGVTETTRSCATRS